MKKSDKQVDQVIHYLKKLPDSPVPPVDRIMRQIRTSKQPKATSVSWGRLVPVLSFVLIAAITGWVIGPEPFWRLGSFLFDKESRIASNETTGTETAVLTTSPTDGTGETTALTTPTASPTEIISTWKPVQSILSEIDDAAEILHELLFTPSDLRVITSNKQQTLLVAGEVLLITDGNGVDFMTSLFSLFPSSPAAENPRHYEMSLSPDGKMLAITQIVDALTTGQGAGGNNTDQKADKTTEINSVEMSSLISQTVLFDISRREYLSMPEAQHSVVVTAWSEDGGWFVLHGSDPAKSNSGDIWRWKRETDSIDRIVQIAQSTNTLSNSTQLIEALYIDKTGLIAFWGDGILSIQQSEFPEEAWIAANCLDKPLFVDATNLTYHTVQNGMLVKTQVDPAMTLGITDWREKAQLFPFDFADTALALPTGITDWRVQGEQAAFMTENHNLFVWNVKTGQWKTFEPNAKDPNYLLPDMIISPDGERILYNGQGEWVMNDGTKDIMYRQENPPGYSSGSAVFTENGDAVISQMPQRKGFLPGDNMMIYLLSVNRDMQPLVSFRTINDGLTYPDAISWMKPTPKQSNIAWDTIVNFGLSFDADPKSLNQNTIRIRDVVHDRDITSWYDITYIPDARLLQLKRNKTAGSLRETMQDFAMSRLDGIEIQFVGPFTDWEGQPVPLDFIVTLSLLPAPMPD